MGADGQPTGGTGTPGQPSSGATSSGGLFKDGQGKTGSDSTGGEGDSDREGERANRLQAAALCQDYRAGRLDDDRRERLSRLARGLPRIPRYCESVLDGVDETGRDEGGRGDSPDASGGRSAGGGRSVGDGDGRAIVEAPAPAPVLTGTADAGLHSRR
ncbi:hypothetical protein [Streptomyces sp. NPDC002990]